MQLTLLREFRDHESRSVDIERIGNQLEIPESIATIDFTHGLHRFPGKFIPQIPRYLLRNYLGKGSRIFDPFCGSGTTLVEACVAGSDCIGCDIDPLSILISRAKVHPLATAELLQTRNRLSNVDWDKCCDKLIPPISNLNHWFSDEAVTQLSALKSACYDLEGPTQSFGLALFSSIIRRVSNADDQTQKTYVSHTKKKTPPLPKQLFPVFLQRALVGMSAYASAVKGSVACNVRLHDSRDSFAEFVFDDVITSPPYIDSIDYAYNQMLEYFWLLPEFGLNSRADFTTLRKRPMGMANSKGDLPDCVATKVSKLSEICDNISAISLKEAQVIKMFFRDYAGHISRLAAVQKPGGIYAVVIASSLIRGFLIPTPEALIAIHESYDYDLIDRFTYGIKRHYMKFPRRENSSKIIEDTVLVFKLRA